MLRKKLKRSELVSGNIYKCELSGAPMLVYSIEATETASQEPTILVWARYYNPVTGLFDKIYILDYQLSMEATNSAFSP